jgi:hypothetical protein
MRYLRPLFWCGVAIVGMVALVAVTPRHIALAAMPYFTLLTLPLAGWVVYDARRIRLREYQSSLAWHPAVVFLLVALWPVVVVPWYLTVRERVLAGQTPRRASRSSAGGEQPNSGIERQP